MSKKGSVPKWLRVLVPAVLIVAWLAMTGIGGPYFGKISDVSSNDLSNFLPNSAESTKVNSVLSKYNDRKTLPLIVVYENGGKDLTNDDIKSIAKANDSLAKIDSVKGKISPPIQSDDKKAALTSVPLVSGTELKTVLPEIKEDLNDAKLPVSYALTGPAAYAYDLQKAFGGIDGTLLLVALSAVFIILLVVYRSPFLPFIVLFTAMAALSVAIFVVYYLAKADIVELNGQVQGILSILVIGAATDYSLLYIARFREELINHRETWQATKVALKSSAEPIIAAGGTVAVGVLCLLLSDLGSNKALGPVGAIGIFLSVIAALTLLPSLLMATGRVAFWPRKPRYAGVGKAHDYKTSHPLWSKVGAFVGRHPRRIWITCTVLLLIACSGILQLKASGVSQSDLILGKSEAREGQKILDEHFASGSGSPMYVLAPVEKQDAVVKMLDQDKGIDSVSVTSTGVEAGFAPVGKADAKIRQDILDKVTEERDKQLETLKANLAQSLAGAPQPVIEAAYEKAQLNIPSAQSIADKAYPFAAATPKVVDGKVLLQATLKDPADSFAARDTVVRVREKDSQIDKAVLVGGVTAIQYDTNQASLHDQKVIIPSILISITIILMLLLRAIVAPLVLLLTTVLSFGSTLGISAFLFNHVWHFPGADPSVVLFGFVFLVALGIDYNIFLMTRVREETQKSGVRQGTIKGLVVTGGVITSAGVVLASTFAALGVIPILFLVQLAFVVAFGVLLDTVIIRSLLVPSLTLEIGKPMWWPSKLWRKS